MTRRQFLRGVGYGGVALSLAGPLAACEHGRTSGSPVATSPKKGGTLVVAMDADAPNLNPMTSQVLETFYPSNQIFDTLVKYDAKFNPIPWLARSWTISGDGKMFSFVLANGVQWHDGQPFSSADVAYTFQEAGPKYSNTYTLVMEHLESLDASDPGRVVLRFSEPAGALLAYLGDPNFNILPKHIYSGTDPRTNPANSHPVGTGPFMFKDWVRGDHLTLSRNANYWQKNLPYLDQIVFRPIPNPAASVSALQQGDVGFVLTQIQPVDAQRLKSNHQIVTLSPSVLARTLDLWPNLRHMPLNQLKVRQAISLAIDRPRMVRDIAFNQTVTARGPLGSKSPYFDTSLPELKRDVSKANQMLDEVGLHRHGNFRLSLNLRVVSSLDQFVKTAEIVKENLADVGIDINIIAAETTTTLDAIFKRWDFDLAVYSIPLGPEPSLQLPAWLGTVGINHAYFSNAEGYSSSTVDQLIAEAQHTVDHSTRAALYKRIQVQIMKDLPLIPLWEPIFISGYRTEFHDPFLAPDDRYINWAMTWEST
ncbi:MAG TPA: ABC transporter substrate-binding protein [Chloroflexota bacterium]|nr:ABC transporter substrate-binding protein [Chloroflexota bacterium]